MALILTADHHFGHADVIRSCNRPFSSVEEMDEAMIENWNDVVNDHDDVIHLGDFGYRIHPRRLSDIHRRLKGRIHLVPGNHDNGATLGLKWASKPQEVLRMTVEGQQWVFCHYALRVWPGSNYGAAHAYGHSHGRLPGIGMSTDVGVDVWDYAPAPASDVLARMIERLEMLADGVYEDPNASFAP